MSAYRVLVVSNVDAPYVRDDCAILGALGPVEFLRYRGRRDLGRLAIASLRSDIIVSWFAIGYATTAVLLGRVLRTPTVVIAAGWDVMALPELNYGALLSKGRARKTRYALEKASVVLAVSASTQEAAQKLVSREILVVPNAVDTNFLRPADLERHNQVITVAGVDNEVRYRVKGIDILVRVAERMQNVRFVLVGRNSPEWDERLRALAPPNLEIMGVHRRLGNWDEALASYKRATRLDPRNANLFEEIGETYRFMGRYAEAVGAYDRALSLAPDFHAAAVERARTYVLWLGELDTLRAVLSEVPADAPVAWFGTAAAYHLRLLHWERQADSMLVLAAATLPHVVAGYGIFLPRVLYAAWAHRLRADHPAMVAAFDSARVLLDSVVKELEGDWRVHAARGMALAGLGRKDGALQEARWLQQSVIYRDDAFDRPVLAEDRGRILAQVGETEAALDEIHRLLTAPSLFSVHSLRLDPLWDPIRDHPRFKALLAKYTQR